MNEVDVAVVGAGPAGTAAGIRLAELGHTVAIVDKADFPRDKICGDGLTTGALRRLEALGVDPADIESWQPVGQVWIRPPYGKEIRFSLPRDQGLFAAVATRRDLDNALVERARAAGVTIHEHASVEAVTQTANGVTLTAEGLDPIHSRFLIAADGMWSPTRKLLGENVDGYRGEWHAFRQYVGNVTGRAATDLVVFFEQDFLPGYFWSFPLPGNRANIGFGIERGGKHAVGDMKALWTDILARPHVRDLLGPDVTPIEPHRAWPIPCRTGELSAAAGRVLFAGDAVAVCDVMTGEGIGQALQTGMMAADAIHAEWNDAGGAAAGLRYGREIDSELGPDHRMASLLVRAIRHRKGASIALGVAAANDWSRRNFIRWLFEDYPRGIAFRPNTWHRGALSGLGAYRD